MRIEFVGKNIELTQSLKDVAEKKFQKLDKFIGKDVDAKVVFSAVRNTKAVEVTIFLDKTILRAEEESDDMYTSIDRAVDVLERQVRKYKTKLQNRYQKNDSIRFENIKPMDEADEAKLVKNKRFKVVPMSSDEAILQMELLRHNFFVFQNAKNEAINVVYKRKDGNYGLIEVE